MPRLILPEKANKKRPENAIKKAPKEGPDIHGDINFAINNYAPARQEKLHRSGAEGRTPPTAIWAPLKSLGASQYYCI